VSATAPQALECIDSLGGSAVASTTSAINTTSHEEDATRGDKGVIGGSH